MFLLLSLTCLLSTALNAKLLLLSQPLPCLLSKESGASFWVVCSSLVQWPWDIEVLYNPSAAPMRLSTLPYEKQPLLMTFPGYVADHSAKTLVDGGATHNYIHAAFAAAKGLRNHMQWACPCCWHRRCTHQRLCS